MAIGVLCSRAARTSGREWPGAKPQPAVRSETATWQVVSAMVQLGHSEMMKNAVKRLRLCPLSGVFAVGSIGLALALSAGPACGQTPADRDVRSVLSDLRRLPDAQAVERLEAVEMNGVPQWVSIRGADRRNPILLIIHGGPGYVSLPTAWWSTRGLEDYFVVVHWDQRGAGLTYSRANDRDGMIESLTYDVMVDDAEAMAAWLRREFDRERLFVLGQSWGTLLGVELAQRRPDWLHAYIGVGQVADMLESERRGWRWAMEQARAAGDSESVAALEALTPYGSSPPSTDDLLAQRRILGRYGGVIHAREGSAALNRAARLSPDYGDEDLAVVWEANELSVKRLFPIIWENGDLTDVRSLRTPVILLSGRHDRNLNSEVAAEWLASLQAPSRTLIWFERSAHEPLSEEPGRALAALVEHALPIAQAVGDVAPAASIVIHPSARSSRP